MGNVTTDTGLLARPRSDGWDTAQIVSHAAARWGWEKRAPSPGAVVWLDAVALHSPEDNRPLQEWTPLLDGPVLEQAAEVLAAWPEMLTQSRALLDEISSWTPNMGFTEEAMGGSCGPGPGFGSIMVCSNNPVGYAQGVVHELGHHKLRALGIDMEEHDGKLLANDPEELYESAVRKDKLRPMSAVLHAHYSYLHVLECELVAAELGYACPMLSLNRSRIAEGMATLREYAEVTETGADFMAGVYAWSEELIDRAAERLGE